MEGTEGYVGAVRGPQYSMELSKSVTARAQAGGRRGRHDH